MLVVRHDKLILFKCLENWRGGKNPFLLIRNRIAFAGRHTKIKRDSVFILWEKAAATTEHHKTHNGLRMGIFLLFSGSFFTWLSRAIRLFTTPKKGKTLRQEIYVNLITTTDVLCFGHLCIKSSIRNKKSYHQPSGDGLWLHVLQVFERVQKETVFGSTISRQETTKFLAPIKQTKPKSHLVTV